MNKDIIYSNDTIELITVATAFADFLESSDTLDKRTFIERTLKYLPTLYLKMSLIPKVNSQLEDSLEDFVSEIDYNVIRMNASRILGSSDRYLETFAQDAELSDTALAADISENLADIYQDIKNFVLRFQVGDEDVMFDALATLQDNFQSFWGQRLTNALRALHATLYNPDTDFDETPLDEQDWQANHSDFHTEHDDCHCEHHHHDDCDCDDPDCHCHH